jgi:hypothetical protein
MRNIKRRQNSASALGVNTAAREIESLGADQALQIMSTAIRHMCNSFRKIERPVLAAGMEKRPDEGRWRF